MRLFLLYFLDALFQSSVCFFVPMLAYGDGAITFTGQTETQTMLGNVMALSVITCTNMYTAINTYSWIMAMFFGMILTMVTLLSFLLVYAILPSQRLYGSIRVFIDPIFWAVFSLTVVLALTPRILLKYVQSMGWPTDLDIVREIKRWGVGAVELQRALMGTGEMFDGFKEYDTTVEQIIPPPPRAMHRISPRKLLGMDFLEDLVEPLSSPMFENDNQPQTAPMGKWRHRFLQKSLALFNVGTDKFERMTGYAFSQEKGMGQVIHREGQPTAFGAVYTGENQMEEANDENHRPFHLTSPDAAAIRGGIQSISQGNLQGPRVSSRRRTPFSIKICK